MPRATEQQILAAMAVGLAVPPAMLNNLLTKVGKDQAKKKGRAATAVTENDFVGIYGALNPADQAVVRTGIVNYVSNSTGINGYLRTGNPATSAGAAATVDAMFNVYHAGGHDMTERISYRLQRYTAGQNVPYMLHVPPPGGGGAAPPHIVPGDLIRDAAFWSTSENRQFIARIPNVQAGDRFVKFVIVGAGGINVAAHYPAGGWAPTPSYSNANEAILDSIQRPGESALAWKMRLKLKSRPAGQAEILYNRGTIFRVEQIAQSGADFNVRVSVPNPQPPAAGVKSAFTGQ